MYMGNICNHKKFYDEKDEEDEVYDKLIKKDYRVEVSIFDDTSNRSDNNIKNESENKFENELEVED